MTSIFSSSSKPPRAYQDRRKRSSSETRSDKRGERARVPIVSFEDNDDVATAICVEISRSMMTMPNMTTGIFFRTMSNSQRDLVKSVATIVMSASILYHIGNDKMAKDLLSRSTTCSKYYDKLGLNDKAVNEMFVTMLFALNPNFATMLNKAMQLSLERASRMTSDEYSKKQLITCMSTLTKTGVIDTNELVSSSSDIVERKVSLVKGNSSLQTTPTEMIHPDDSASAIGRIPSYRRNINQQDMMNYLNRKKRGKEPEFKDVFKSAKENEPIASIVNKAKRGLGYKTPEEDKTDVSNFINDILGTHRKDSYVLSTGDKRTRAPRVEDFLDSTSISGSAVYTPKFVDEVSYEKLDRYNTRAPSPTEINLADTEYETSAVSDRTLTKKDSFELLMESLGN